MQLRQIVLLLLESRLESMIWIYDYINEHNKMNIKNTHENVCGMLLRGVFRNFIYCLKWRNFTKFPGVQVLWEGTVST